MAAAVLGAALLGVEEEIDPLLDPVMEKRIIQKGRSKFINVADGGFGL